MQEANLGGVNYHKVVLEEATPEDREQRQHHSPRLSGEKKEGSNTGTMTARRAYPTAGENQKIRKEQSQQQARQEQSQQQSNRASQIWRKMEKLQSLTRCRNLSPKARREAKATTKPKAEPTSTPKPKPFRGDRTGGALGSFEQSRKSETDEKRKMKEADVQGVSQATTVAVALKNTMAVGSTPGGTAETRRGQL